MAFCKYCGRKLSENEICNCRKPETTYKPDIDLNSYPDNENISVETTETPKKKKLSRKKSFVIILIVLILILVSGINSYMGNAYKIPLKRAVRGINKNNIELILEQFMTEDMLEQYKEKVTDEENINWKEYCEDTNEGIEELKEYIEDDFGKRFKVSAKVIETKDAKKREQRSIEEYCESIDMECNIKKAYKLKTEITLKGKDEEKTMKVWLYSAKLKDEGWKIVFDEETLDDFEYELDDIIDTKVYNDIAEDIF
ncbi:MAG: hypothetical protein K2K66_04755 [Ruminococcus sp.]|nr:hypothetical protein [Ruminococcus sp.]